MLPVWLLLAPRGYLSSFTKIGTILLLAFGVMIVNPELKMPALTEFAGGGGPIIPGPLFPFAFITIACGAISGFHALISSGTTSKMVDKETDIRPIGYGAMLVEGVVGIMALIAATAMPPGDYFAINVAPAAYEQLTFQGEQLQHNLGPIEAAVGEKVEGRTGGAVSLAVGMAMIFSALPGMSGLLVLLVPLRDHVRGALHPDHHRLRDTGRALPDTGSARQGLRAVRAHRLDARRLSSPPG